MRARVGGRRRGMSFIELLITVAIIAALVGVAVPLAGFILDDARELRTKRVMNEVRKALLETVNSEDGGRRYVPDCELCPILSMRPEAAASLGILVPKKFPIIPVDGFGEELVRVGNSLISGGKDRELGTHDDVVWDILNFPNLRDPESGLELQTGEEAKAMYQVSAIALHVRRLFQDNWSPTPSLRDQLIAAGQALPLDPWDREFFYEGPETNPTYIVSLGEDPDLDEDDLRAPIGKPLTWTDDFSGGPRDWARLFPGRLGSSDGGTSHAALFPPRDPNDGSADPPRVFRFRGMGTGAGAGRAPSYWVKLLPSGLHLEAECAVEVDVDVDRSTAGTSGVRVGVFLGYEGRGTGYLGFVQVDGDGAVGRVFHGVPAKSGRALRPRMPGSEIFASGPVAEDPSFRIRLSYTGGASPRILLSSTGAVSGSVEFPVPTPPGSRTFGGIMVGNGAASARFNAEFDDFKATR